MSYDIETYIQMFPNIEPYTIKIICEQNASPEITLETLLEISNSITTEAHLTSNILRGLSFFNNAPTGYKPINNKENDNDQI